jgi:alpha-tubulin suppressor-like RCC1 family protein
LALSSDRIIALAASGAVYSVPVSREDQLVGTKPLESTWIPFWNARSSISYREVTPKLSWGERISSVTAGLSHALLLSSTGRVFSLAASSNAFPMHGELGIPGLTWMTRPDGHFDQPHELGTLQGFDIKAIASGDHHNLVLDSAGRVFAFGDNSSGQLGFEPMAEIPFVDAPALLPMTKLYAGTAQVPKVTSIAAGGSNSFFTVDATRVAQPDDPMNVPMSYAPAEPARNPLLGKITADTWACGSGILGTLGNGRWTHIQGLPTKIKALSGLFEYDERKASVIPIRLAALSVGATHAAAVMDNVTYLGARAHTSEHDTNWGADILWWGGNEFYQVGTGRRNNLNSPVYIGPLDGANVDGTNREEHRFQITPRHRVKVGGRSVTFEQRVECGRCVTAVYSGL